MNRNTVLGGFSCVLASLVFIAGVVTPGFVHAQTQGDTSSWVDRLLGGPVNPTTPSGVGAPPVDIGNIIRGFITGATPNTTDTPSEGTDTTSTATGFNLNDIGGIITNAYNNPLETAGNVIQGGLNFVGTVINGLVAFVENPVSSTVNTAIDAYVAVGNQVGWWSNTSVGGTTFGDPGQIVENAGQSIVNTFVDGIVAITNEILNANSDPGTPAEDNAITGERAQPVDPSGTGKGSARPNDTRGHNPSGLGGLGSPSNPLSTGESDTTGANSDDIGTNNVQTQTSPYLFEPVPGGENNAGEHNN